MPPMWLDPLRAVARWRPTSDTFWDLLLNTLKHIAGWFFTHVVLRADGTVDRKLLNLGKVTARSSLVKGVRAVDITVDSRREVWCRVYLPAEEANHSFIGKTRKLPLIVFYHGGGFMLCGPDSLSFDFLCRNMSKASRAVVVSLSYRLAPEAKLPTQYEDAWCGFEWVREQCTTPHESFPANIVDFSRVFLAGDSAGGNIAHHLAVRIGATDVSPISVSGLILLMPFFGGEERMPSEIRLAKGQFLELAQSDFAWRAFLPPESDRDHPSVNVCGSRSPTFSGMKLPRILVLVGEWDILQDRQIQYANLMRAAHKDCEIRVFEKAFHGCYFFGNLAKATVLMQAEIASFVNAQS